MAAHLNTLQRASQCVWPRQCRLPQVISEVCGSSEQNRESIPMRLPLEILFRHRSMPPRPIRGRELQKIVPQFLVDFLPCSLERLSRDRQLNGLVRVRKKHDVEFGMKSFSNPEQRQETVVHGGEVSPQINQAVLSRSNLFLKLFCRQSAKQLGRT